MGNGSHPRPPGVGKLKVGELLLLQTLDQGHESHDWFQDHDRHFRDVYCDWPVHVA